MKPVLPLNFYDSGGAHLDKPLNPVVNPEKVRTSFMFVLVRHFQMLLIKDRQCAPLSLF